MNYILQDKFTFPSGFYDNESAHLGAFLSGYAGNYGIRFDECGWRSNSNDFAESSGIAAVMEHFLLTGATVTDGPETIPMQATHQISSGTNSLGYTYKRWEMYPQMVDIHVDMFRNLIDGTFRIPGRLEVIDRTKIAYINDITDGSNEQKYSSEPSLYTGLYAMDGELSNNRTWFKKTGRYPSIPMLHKDGQDLVGSFQTSVKQSEYSSRWPSIQSKVNEFNTMFPCEYSGDGFAARIKNTWLTYNPYKDGNQKSLATIPFKYNTCDSISLSYSRFSNGIINEYSDKLHFYLNNYCTSSSYGMREDVITIYGSSNEPTYTYNDRGRVSSQVTKTWENGIFTLSITHNGPLDLDINCSGNATDKLTDYPEAVQIVAPARPPVYKGPHQYEAENFDYKNFSRIDETSLKYYTAMGYLTFGNNAAASIMDSISVLQSGDYLLQTRYRAPNATVKTIDLYINGKKVATPTFTKTANDNRVWDVNIQNVSLNKGANSIEFRANAASSTFYIDNIIIARDIYDFASDSASTDANSPEHINAQSGTVGVVDYPTINSSSNKCLKAYSVGTVNDIGVADLELFSTASEDYSVIWKEYNEISGGRKGLLLRGNGSSSYENGLKQGYLFVTENNSDGTFTLKTYLVDANSNIEKQSYVTTAVIAKGEPCWFRATAVSDKLIFECSSDSANWEGDTETVIIDSTYSAGSTQFVWGLGNDTFNWVVDNIRAISGTISVVPDIVSGLNYVQGDGPSESESFVVSGNSLLDNIKITPPDEFEVSLNANSGFADSLTLTLENNTVTSTIIHVRLKAGLNGGTYNDAILINSTKSHSCTLDVSGEVENPSITKIYNFALDEPGTKATNPPALNISVGQDNSATAGVKYYTDSKKVTSKVLKPYKGGQREGTGVLNLDLFSKQATNYSVTWKECLGSGSENYKIGVLLRGDTANVGNGVLGYVEGIMHGYLFLAYTNRGSNNTQFRIYKSTSEHGVLNFADVGFNVNPSANQPIWYRASVRGSLEVYLKLEYSLNGKSWKTGATYTDAEASFIMGATQFVWGFGTYSTDFYIDDIMYEGVSLDEDTQPEIIEEEPYVSVKNISASTQVLYQEYYNLMGQKVNNPYLNGSNGIYIVRSIMSDSSVKAKKVFIDNK